MHSLSQTRWAKRYLEAFQSLVEDYQTPLTDSKVKTLPVKLLEFKLKVESLMVLFKHLTWTQQTLYLARDRPVQTAKAVSM